MLVNTMTTRIRYQIEDPNSDLYTDAEVLAALNLAKDEVLAQVLTISDSYGISSETISFAVGDKEKTLSSTGLGILRVEYTPDGASHPYGCELHDIRDQDGWDENQDVPNLWVRWGVDNTKIYLGRRHTETAQTFLVYYLTDVSDYVAGGSVLFAPTPACNLIISKATNSLLAARDRRNPTFMLQEQKQEQLLPEVLARLRRSGPRYVNYVKQ